MRDIPSPQGLDLNRFVNGSDYDPTRACAACGLFEAKPDVHRVRVLLLPERLAKMFPVGWICYACVARTSAKLRKAKETHDVAARAKQRKTACPKWVDRKALGRIYGQAKRLSAETGIPYHVDHEIPLLSPVVCGLEVPWNLRIIPAAKNLQKSNRLIEPEPKKRVAVPRLAKKAM